MTIRIRQLTTLSMALLALGWLLPNTASAEFLPNAIQEGVTAEAYDYDGNSNGRSYRAVDGSGLTVDSSGDGFHSTNWEDGWQATLSGNMWFIADLGASYDTLESLYVWNVNEAGSTNRGTKDVDIYYSNAASNPGSDFTTADWTLLGNYTFNQGPGTADAPVSNIIDLNTVAAARFFGLDIQSNYGDTVTSGVGRVGLAELQFVTAVPEPSTLLLTAIGLLGCCLFLARRRRT